MNIEIGNVIRMNCGICHRGPAQGISIFRQNPKGEKGIWRCLDHSDEKIDIEVLEIVEALEDPLINPDDDYGARY